MLIKEYGHSWPPSVTIGEQLPPTAELEDIVLSVEKCGGNPKGQLGLRMRNQRGEEYTAALPVPASLQQKILLSILRRENMTLREVGELPIAESAFVEPAMSTSQSSLVPASPAKQTRRTRLSGALRPVFARASATIAMLLQWLE